VRREENIKILQDECNAKHILNSTSPTFDSDYQQMIDEVKPNILIDYLGGEFPYKLFEKMGQDSILVPTGAITLEKGSYDYFHLIS
jgi:hypothetical protein